MLKIFRPLRLVLAVCGLVAAAPYSADAQSPAGSGFFEAASEIGDPGQKGSVSFDAARGVYTVSGGGENMWFGSDELFFVYKRAEGDLSLAADIAWPDAGGDPHKKACLIIRQSLEPDAAYADAVIHGDGLCSIQYRETAGENTHEIQSKASGPQRLRIEKRGDYVSMSIGSGANDMQPSGCMFRIRFDEPFYVGLGVCAHNDAALATARFSNVAIEKLEPRGAIETLTNSDVASTLETIAIASTDRRVVYHAAEHFEAPNWTPDGQSLIYNSRGSLYRVSPAGGEPMKIDTGNLNRLNNDHGISPDGKTLVVSDQTRAGGSRIYTLPIEGGKPTLITEAAPSYWHGWSPDGKTLAYCAQREGEFDIYTCPAAGGPETRLTTAAGLDDGPDYSADGKFIYFNSDRTGRMHIWRMNADGSQETQVTNDDFNNWFPHPSPDGRWVVFLTYGAEVEGHPANKDVMLKLLEVGSGEIRVLAKLFGGQGTINVPSWSPDSKHIAFVSYQPLPK